MKKLTLIPEGNIKKIDVDRYPTKLSYAEVIRRSLPEIQALQDKGLNSTEICAAIEETTGVKIAPSTFQPTLSRLKRALANETTRTPHKRPAPIARPTPRPAEANSSNSDRPFVDRDDL